MRTLPFAVAAPTAEPRQWYTLAAAKDKPRTAELLLYGTIGGWWNGVDAKKLAQELAGLDVDEIRMRVHSPGGDAMDGVAIYNALVRHKATIVATVDGMAASAASLIFMAADERIVGEAAQVMIHDPWMLAIGNPAELRKAAADLDRTANEYAGVYAKRSGRGTTADWREVMGAETWYSGAEAVEAGIADRADGDVPPGEETVDMGESTDLGDLEDELARAVRHAFRYAGRTSAPTPTIPPVSAGTATVDAAEAMRRIHAASLNKTPGADPATGRTTREGAAEMQFTDEERAGLRARFSLPADADDDAIKAALMAPPAAPSNEPTGPAAPAKPAQTSGTMTIDVSAWQEREERLKRLEAADAKRRRDERDQVVAQAVADGKFPPARKEHWVRLWDADPEGTRQVIDGLAKNVVPVAALGHSGDVDSDQLDDEFAALFPPARKGA